MGTLIFEARQRGFKSDSNSQRQTPDPAELAERQRKQQAEDEARQRKADRAAEQSEVIWKKAEQCVIHAYSESKHISPQPARIQFANAAECKGWFWTTNDDGEMEELTGKLLLLPLYNIGGELRGLQAMDEPGRKSLIRGLGKQGLSYLSLAGNFLLITPANSISRKVLPHRQQSEGNRDPAVSAIDAGNLIHVAQAWRQKLPHAEIIIAGDLDKSGTGQKKPNEAALAVGGMVALPPFTDEELTVESHRQTGTTSQHCMAWKP